MLVYQRVDESGIFISQSPQQTVKFSEATKTARRGSSLPKLMGAECFFGTKWIGVWRNMDKILVRLLFLSMYVHL